MQRSSESAELRKQNVFLRHASFPLFIYQNHVYEPEEDSFLMAESVAKKKGLICEIGCGTGICTIYNLLNNPHNKGICFDVNELAVDLTRRNARLNHVEQRCNVLHCSFEDPSPLLNQRFDTIFFNPPYLPDPDDQEPMAKALFGGPTGVEVAIKSLDFVVPRLKPDGEFLILLSTCGDVGKFEEAASSLFEIKTVAQTAFFFEKLVVFSLRLKHSP